MGRMNELAMEADEAIIDNDYEGIMEQDGWETLELTIYSNHPALQADYIMDKMKEVAGI